MKNFLLTFFSLFISLSMLLTSCSQGEMDSELDNSPSTTPQFGPNFKFYTDANLFVKAQSQRTFNHSDPFTIGKVSGNRDKLVVEVTYSGGCSEHEFEVVWDGVVQLSHPGKVNLVLKHNSNKESCEALITDHIEIDLKRYFNDMIDADNTVFIVSNGSSVQEITSEKASLSK